MCYMHPKIISKIPNPQLQNSNILIYKTIDIGIENI